MSIDFEEFNQELARLDAIKSKRTVDDENERRALATELFQTFAARLNLMQWRQVITKVIARHTRRGVLPVISDFKAALSSMYASGEVSVNLCPGCNGVKMVYTRVRHRRTGIEIDACRPCPRCQPQVEFSLKPELEHVVNDDVDPMVIRMAKALGPKGAYFALQKAEACGANLDDDVKMILLEKAGEYEATAPAPEKLEPPTPFSKAV